MDESEVGEDKRLKRSMLPFCLAHVQKNAQIDNCANLAQDNCLGRGTVTPMKEHFEGFTFTTNDTGVSCQTFPFPSAFSLQPIIMQRFVSFFRPSTCSLLSWNSLNTFPQVTFHFSWGHIQPSQLYNLDPSQSLTFAERLTHWHALHSH